MSEIREELEYFAQLAEENEKRSTDENSLPTNLSQETTSSDVDKYLEAPKGYEKELAETFKELPLEWRRYLHAREDEVDKGFSNLRNRNNAYKWLEDAFIARSGELQKNGIKSSEEWLKNIVSIDAMLEKNPVGTIAMLADAYGVGQTNLQSALSNNNRILTNIMSEHLVAKQLNDFISEIDNKGNLKHPYYREVLSDMYELINRGIVKNLADAYETAVWSNSNTRSKLIAERTKETLELKSKNAQKSKDAAFAPKGKAPLDAKDLTLREELEMRFAELEDDD